MPVKEPLIGCWYTSPTAIGRELFLPVPLVVAAAAAASSEASCCNHQSLEQQLGTERGVGGIPVPNAGIRRLIQQHHNKLLEINSVTFLNVLLIRPYNSVPFHSGVKQRCVPPPPHPLC